jgi:lipopolysaccharide transport system ATP-binding protein
MNKDIVINCENVTKTYKLFDSPADRVKEAFHPFRKKYHRPFNALDNLSFSVRKGESLGIIGRNGSGKSTLLQIVSGILIPTSGNVEVQGRISALLELGTGFNLEFTGRQNVHLSAYILGLKKEETDEKFQEIAAFADIGEFIDQPVKIYSSGMMMRLGFAVQSAVNPGIMIVDEVLAVGDMRFSMKCLRKMHELMEKGTAFLFVSHDMSSVVNFCDEVIWLHDGRILESGSPKQITMNYANFMSYGLMPSKEKKVIDGSLSSAAGSCIHTFQSSNCDNTEAKKYSSLFWIDLAHLPSTGVRGATIERAALAVQQNPQNSYIVAGGEDVEIFVGINSEVHLRNPNVNVDFRDKKGNLIFGLNLLLFDQAIPDLIPGEQVIVLFRFTFPLILNGEYSICLGLTDGPVQSRNLHHSISDALLINVVSTVKRRNHYLISLEDITIDVLPVDLFGS